MQAPRDLGAALDILARQPGAWKPFAGGTDLMVLLESDKLPQRRFVSVWGLPELRGIEETPDSLTLGALTTYTEIRQHPVLAREFPLLCLAAAETGGIATQNRGTLEEISPTPLPPRIRRRLCSFMMLNSSWFPRAAGAGSLTIAFTRAIN